MAIPDPKKCGYCNNKMRLLQERTQKLQTEVFICPQCDGRLINFTRFDGDPPRQ